MMADGLPCIRLLEEGPDAVGRNTIRLKPTRMIPGRLMGFGYDVLCNA